MIGVDGGQDLIAALTRPRDTTEPTTQSRQTPGTDHPRRKPSLSPREGGAVAAEPDRKMPSRPPFASIPKAQTQRGKVLPVPRRSIGNPASRASIPPKLSPYQGVKGL